MTDESVRVPGNVAVIRSSLFPIRRANSENKYSLYIQSPRPLFFWEGPQVRSEEGSKGEPREPPTPKSVFVNRLPLPSSMVRRRGCVLHQQQQLRGGSGETRINHHFVLSSFLARLVFWWVLTANRRPSLSSPYSYHYSPFHMP